MLESLIKRLSGAPEPVEIGHPADQIAIAAILVEAARADDEYLDAERQIIEQILIDQFAITTEQAQELRGMGEQAQSEATDLVRFTRVLKDAIPIDERVRVIEAVWRVVYADDKRDADEANLIRRLCGLLYVPDREAGLARQRVFGSGT